jgi:transposase
VVRIRLPPAESLLRTCSWCGSERRETVLKRRRPRSGEQGTTIGLDIAKHVFQVHGADAAGHVLFRKRITRAKLLGFLAAQAPGLVAMEACAGAHYWAREIGKLLHHVRLIAPAYVKPFIRRQKNDAADAEAICAYIRRTGAPHDRW